MATKKIRMILDAKGNDGSLLYSNVLYKLEENFAKKLIKEGKAFEHVVRKIAVSKEKKYYINGEYKTRSEMLKMKGIRMY